MNRRRFLKTTSGIFVPMICAPRILAQSTLSNAKLSESRLNFVPPFTIIMQDYMTNGTTNDTATSTLDNTGFEGNFGFTPALQGSFSLDLVGDTSIVKRARYNLGQTYTELWAIFQLKILGSLPSSGNWAVVGFTDASNVTWFELDINLSGTMKTRAGGVSSGGTTNSMSAATLYYIQVHLKTAGSFMEAEFSTTPTGFSGSGNNYTSVNGGATSPVQKPDFENAGVVGTDWELDSIKVSTGTYATFP